jgi:phenylpropionate dioxygenase-like ring-hydroxylating dioxygenase large terminal subunit
LTEEPLFLTNLWYMAGLSASLKVGAMCRAMLCGEPVLLGRTKEGAVFALRDICPHRAAPLSAGRIREGTVECPYHGWRFKPDGQCIHIPSLLQDQDMSVGRIRVQSYPVHEQDGLIWVYFAADAKSAPAPPREPPRIPSDGATGNAVPRFVESQLFPCEVDHAVVGLMDPAHGPFVHNAWWWRRETSIHAKEKRHAPSERGFTMVTHKPSSNSLFYRVLGGDISTEIRFELPGLRFEHIRAGRVEILGFTAVTPQDAAHTLVSQVFYWPPALSLFKPFFQPFARAFLGQDRKMVELQHEGLKFSPPQMLIQDADVPAIWYHRLKKAWAESVKTGAPFVNPVQERTLRWRS